MSTTVQISAFISRSTKDLLERETRASGVKKGHLLEEALRHHLQALHEVPAEFIVHPVLVVSEKSGPGVLKKLKRGQAGRGEIEPKIGHRRASLGLRAEAFASNVRRNGLRGSACGRQARCSEVLCALRLRGHRDCGGSLGRPARANGDAFGVERN